MIGLSNIASRMIEFHRFGRPEAIFSPDSKYIRTTGWDDPAREVSPSFNYETLLENLNMLRYEDVGNDEEVRAAREALADEAARLLPPTTVGDKELLQIDIVTNAGELWAFPFEAPSRGTPTGCSTRTVVSC